MTILRKCRPFIGLFLVASLVLGQDYGQDYPDYQDYADEQDNLYANYAQRQQEKEVGGGGGYVMDIPY